MLKIKPNPLCITKIAKNGIKAATLKTAGGLSVIGAALSVGAVDGDTSGQTFLTLQARLLDAIGKPEDCYRNCITSYLKVFKEQSILLFSFPSESSRKANSMLDLFFCKANPSPSTVGKARHILSQQERLGTYSESSLLESIACSASFSDKKHQINPITTSTSTLQVNQSILNNLQSSSILIGSSDQLDNLSSLASSFSPTSYQRQTLPTQFQSGYYTQKSSGNSFIGNKLLKHMAYPHIAISFPAASIDSSDYYTYKVIQSIFGSCSEFSSEGIGTGLNSVLYKNAITGGCEFLRCEFWPYRGTGLISFVAKAREESLRKIARNTKKSIDIALKINDEDLEMAKEQTINSYLKETDDYTKRFVAFGLENLTWNESRDTSSVIEYIRGIPKDKILDCIKKSFSVKPSIGINGDAEPEFVAEAWK
ncbi:Clan ME, family M16, insulinase-like metallopeptidase [Histomonas meleagridis]|uniref:Clan ME, family M16, insulinase-like metallopeptidase n=1 Tax=Histomonas meleagridis TaxID=135588 RepID=UPI00355AC75D|nr:Clan ME, family M16, insulinase-like metallopeptidase [Histomonas meleagridis]KAH0805164.1 Clan ME, family M16, insulinase-like metallopeptidase [Histomonas meleagridis]